MPGRARRAPPRGSVLAIEGPSGAGKSTLARALSERLGAERVEEAYARLSPRPSLEFAGPLALHSLERRLLDEETRRYREAVGLARAGRDVVLDTGFLGPLTYAAGLAGAAGAFAPTARRLLGSARRRVLAGALGLPDRIVFLQLPERTARARSASGPDPPSIGLRRRHARIGRFERALWEERFAPLAPQRWLPIRASGPARTVLARVERALSAHPAPGPPPRALSSAWLDRIEAALGRRRPSRPIPSAPGPTAARAPPAEGPRALARPATLKNRTRPRAPPMSGRRYRRVAGRSSAARAIGPDRA